MQIAIFPVAVVQAPFRSIDGGLEDSRERRRFKSPEAPDLAVSSAPNRSTSSNTGQIGLFADRSLILREERPRSESFSILCFIEIR